jgi:hypothetical protein
MSTLSRDQRYDPAGTRLYGVLSGNVPVPECIKDASSDDLYGAGDLPQEAYADPNRREFPCHTKAACWLSAAFLASSGMVQEEPNRYDRVKGALLKLAAVHNVLGDVESALGLREVEKTAAVQGDRDEDYALVTSLADGSAVRRYRISNPSEVKAAAAYLTRHRDGLPYADRRVMAGRILAKAAALKVALDPDAVEALDRQAGLATGTASAAAQELRRRADCMVSREPKLAAELNDAAADCLAFPEKARAKMAGLAEALDALDREYGLTVLYDNGGWRRPEDVLLGVTEKVASEFLDSHCRLMTGNVYAVNDFHRLDPGAVGAVFGDDFLHDVAPGGVISASKMAEAAAALPVPDAEILERLLAGLGARPAVKEAAPGGYSWLTTSMLAELASA